MAIGPLGAITHPPRAVPVSASIAALLPKNATVRGVLQAHLTLEGEELIVYEVPCTEELCFNYSILAIRGGKLINEEVGAEEMGLLGFAKFSLESGREAVVIAFSSSGDGAETDFQFFWADGPKYKVRFSLGTQQGRIEILEGLPTRLFVWSAREDLDGRNSCVWCTHRYEVKSYVWNGKQFEERKHEGRITAAGITPGTIASQPILVKRNPKT